MGLQLDNIVASLCLTNYGTHTYILIMRAFSISSCLGFVRTLSPQAILIKEKEKFFKSHLKQNVSFKQEDLCIKRRVFQKASAVGACLAF